MFNKRKGIIIWLYSLRGFKALKRFGNIYYVSKRMKYVVLYTDAEKVDDIIQKISSLRVVKNVEISHRDELDVDFKNKIGASKIKENEFEE